MSTIYEYLFTYKNELVATNNNAQKLSLKWKVLAARPHFHHRSLIIDFLRSGSPVGTELPQRIRAYALLD